MNNNHSIKDLDLLYFDAKKIINDIILGKIDTENIKVIDTVIDDIEKYWHGQDAIIQINKLIDTKNVLIENRDILGDLAVYISMLAKNYRDAQNSNGTVLPPLLQLEYKNIEKRENINANSSEVYMNNELSNTINSLNDLVISINEVDNSVVSLKNSIMNNWIQDDANRNYALKMFDKYSDNSIIIVNNIKEIIKAINTSIDNYNKSLNSINSMPSLESMVHSNINLKNEYTPEEKKVLDSIKKNFDTNKKLNDSFNRVLVSEVKKDLESKGVL